MEKYYYTSEWNDKKGFNVCWVFKVGDVKHIATFYGEEFAKEYVNFKNKKDYNE
jgi:hypothetical protein